MQGLCDRWRPSTPRLQQLLEIVASIVMAMERLSIECMITEVGVGRTKEAQ